jgi:quercetin dioxygenase-like cupin family protein
MLHLGDAHLAQSFRVVVSPAKLGMQPLCLQWKGWIVFGTGDQQQRGLRVTSGNLVNAGDEVEPAGDRARGVAPWVADVESSFVGRNRRLARERAERGTMVKITDKSSYSRFARPAREDEGIWLDHVEVHLVTHPVGQVKPMHTHDPPLGHVIVMRSGRMRWTVEDQTLEAEAGDVIVTPAGTAHGYEVLGDEPARVVSSTRLRYRSQNREGVPKTLKIVGLGGSLAGNSKSRAALRTALDGAGRAPALQPNCSTSATSAYRCTTPTTTSQPRRQRR